ncbi:LOW QUALITY PROTEIN: hypothetical protein GQ55_5G077200 [Panicum hallii var. hallii]|uniref:KIB1-4 beta-propeller domain-containing protein n=1 Tax=Panicum hallii var. hallii TaxID=1504633 RepID=A0A2T7DE00_9POAL|nr:LOW QUALITY PROTEIN: hypothetical protein GQ55_5G077200 [Panicum hallii var. hallii]
MEESTNAPAGAGSCPPLGTLPVLVYDHGLGPNNRQTAFAIEPPHERRAGAGGQLLPRDSHGWVLLVAPWPSPRTRLWNPRSGESVILPAMERELLEDWECCLSDAPTAPSCVVLVLDTKKPKFLYCRVGDSLWSVHEYDIGNVKLPPEYAPPRKFVIQQTAARPEKLGIIDFSPATPEFSYVDRPCPEFPDGSNCLSELLVESRGELFSVYICLKGFTPEFLTVSVYRIYLSGRPTLSKVDDLGDRVFLLSYTNVQLQCSASKYGVKGNRVYFNHNVMGDMDGGLLCIFDLDEQSLKTLRSCPEMAELLRNPFWMLPTDQDSTRGADK